VYLEFEEWFLSIPYGTSAQALKFDHFELMSIAKLDALGLCQANSRGFVDQLARQLNQDKRVGVNSRCHQAVKF